MRAYQHQHVVTLDETNLVGNVYFAHYLHWQGHCRERFLADNAPGVLKELQAGDLVLVTVSCAMDYYAECFALEKVDVEMSLRAKGGNRVTMMFEYRRDGQLVARGVQTVACLRRTGSGVRPTEIPAELTGAIARYE